MQNKFTIPTAMQIKQRLEAIPSGIWQECPNCHSRVYFRKLKSSRVCPECGYGFRIGAWRRVKLTFDKFHEWDADLATDMTGIDERYSQKLASAKKKTRINESVLTGEASINNQKFAAGVMDSRFVMGSLGKVTGEKLTRMFERATAERLPVILFTASGGARMQDGIVSLMQMAKVSDAVAKHSEAGLLYVSVLTDPTTGGVTASFAMQADVIIAEPHTLIGFAGRRVIEQTIQQKPPVDFQKAETLLENGFLDSIVEREGMKQYLGQLLTFYV